MRPAARTIRELPPRPRSYRVAVFFRAAPLAAPAVVRSTAGCGNRWAKKKPLSLTPVREPKSCELRPPHAGSGSYLTAFNCYGSHTFAKQNVSHLLGRINNNQRRDKPLHPVTGYTPSWGTPSTGDRTPCCAERMRLNMVAHAVSLHANRLWWFSFTLTAQGFSSLAVASPFSPGPCAGASFWGQPLQSSLSVSLPLGSQGQDPSTHGAL